MVRAQSGPGIRHRELSVRPQARRTWRAWCAGRWSLSRPRQCPIQCARSRRRADPISRGLVSRTRTAAITTSNKPIMACRRGISESVTGQQHQGDPENAKTRPQGGSQFPELDHWGPRLSGTACEIGPALTADPRSACGMGSSSRPGRLGCAQVQRGPLPAEGQQVQGWPSPIPGLRTASAGASRPRAERGTPLCWCGAE